MILSAGLTPAWQQTLIFDHLRWGEVNRANEATWCASGKVLNVGIAAARLGGESLTLSVFGGHPGAAMQADLQRLNVPMQWVATNAATRVCTTLIDRTTNVVTELVENAASLTDDELRRYGDAYEHVAAAATHVVLSGSLPAGTPSDFYARLMRRTPESVRVLLDCRGPELRSALALRPFLVKPNREELGRTVGRRCETDDEIWDAMEELRTLGAEWVVVSDGGRSVRALSTSRRMTLRPPARPVANPIGCGDCLCAGIAWALRDGQDPVDAIRFGMAAAADNLSQWLPARISLERVRALLGEVTAID